MARHFVAVSGVLAVLAASGCVINATAPINANTNIDANTQVQANTQVDQRQGEFVGGSGQTQTGQANQVNSGGQTSSKSPAPTKPEPTTNTAPKSELTFAAVKRFSSNAVPYVVDYQTVLVADAKDLFVSTNAGEDWKKIESVSAQQIWAMTWLNPSTGWIGGDEGSLLKLNLDDNEVKKEVLDSGTTETIIDIHFETDEVGFLYSYRSNGNLKKTSDGGETWSDNIPVNGGGKLRYDDDRKLFGVSTTTTYSSDVAYGNLFRYQTGALFPVESETHFFDDITFGAKQYYLHGFKRDENTRYGGAWYRSTDLSNFETIGRDLKTDVQIHRDQRVTNLFVLPDKTLFGALFAGYTGQRKWTHSSDNGKTWTEPRQFSISGVRWLKFFGDGKAWGWDGSTLFRSGG